MLVYDENGNQNDFALFAKSDKKIILVSTSYDIKNPFELSEEQENYIIEELGATYILFIDEV